ncbi:MAG: cation-translocating P-type ATPase [Promethearchaeota archaeon]|nr:MAG: cation-translocating P-type ATPase [Candidatus Lokiarchaeota archaeon]
MRSYSASIDEILKDLGTSKAGLSQEEVQSRLEKYGYNEILAQKRRSLLNIFIGQFKDFLIVLLIAAMVISIILSITGEEEAGYTDAIIIGAILFINAGIGTFLENKSEESLEALNKLSAPTSKVRRNGQEHEIPARELVPGDILILETGNKMAADARLISAVNLKINEAALTGESVPVSKKEVDMDDVEIPINDQKNMVFTGTIITYGRGEGIVIGTGMNTEIGKIAKMIQTIEDEETPLQKRINQLGKWIGILVIIICVIVFTAGFIRYGVDELNHSFLQAVSLAVAAVPEGLPIIVTIALTLGVTRMAAKNAIIRKLPAVETLGCTTVICSDKTGTLTMNEMSVRKLYTNDNLFDLTGSGYEPLGTFYHQNSEIDPSQDAPLLMTLKIGALCNDASLSKKEEVSPSKQWEMIGDPTEGALIVSAAKANLWKSELEQHWARIGEIPFDSNRKRMTTIHSSPEGERYAFVKGALESLLEISSTVQINGEIFPLTEETKTRYLGMNEELTGDALRILAMAYKKVPVGIQEFTIETIETDLTLTGMQAMIDPPRKEVKDALEECRQAGIKIAMITGDHKLTAVAVAKELGLMRQYSGALTGSELNEISPEILQKMAGYVDVYARVSPEQKTKILDAYKGRTNVVAMTGDGVNDSPALRKADVGIAMGITGTDVAKEASDMTLADDNFATIVSAVQEGRVIYDNIKKFIFYTLSSNVGEILVVFIAVLFAVGMIAGAPVAPLVAIHILTVNLVTDGLPGTALAFDPPNKAVMQKPPRDPEESILTRRDLINIAVVGITITIATLIAFIIGLNLGDSMGLGPKDQEYYAQTFAFLTLSFAQFFNVFLCREQEQSIIKGPSINKMLILTVAGSIAFLLIIVYVKPIAEVFHLHYIGFLEWGIIILLSSSLLFVMEAFKLIWRYLQDPKRKKLEFYVQRIDNIMKRYQD